MGVRAIEVLADERQRLTSGLPSRILRLARRKPLGVLSVVVIVVMVLAAVFADALALHDPYVQHIDVRLSPPLTIAPDGKIYILGGDELGRDVFVRIVYGARISLYVGLLSVVVGTTAGSLIGLLSGYFGGKLDLLIQRLMDGQQAIPTLVLAMLIISVLPPSVINVIVAIGIVSIPSVNRVVRSAVLATKENVYVEAARVIGCTARRVMIRHILPNVTAPIIILATVQLGGAILTEASLSFLGLGTPPPTPSWGMMISDSGKQMVYHPLLLILPGTALSLAVMAFNLAGDALRDVWDPRLRGSR